MSVDEVGVGLVVEGRGGVGGFLDLPHSGWTTEPRFSVSNPPALCPLALSVTICASMKKKKILLLNQRHLPPEAQPVALLSGEDNTADERTHRECIYPGVGPDNCIPMDLLGKKKKKKTCRAYFTRKYSELDVAHFLFYSLSFFSLSSLVFMSHPFQSRHAFMLSQNTLATVAKTGVKLKQGRAFGFIWFWFVLCEEFRSTFYPCCSQKTDNFTSWFRYSGIGRRRPCLALLLWNHVFCMYLFF